MALPAGALFQWEAPLVSSPPANGVALLSMIDQSGNGHTAAQGASGSRAIWRSDGWGLGVPAAEFDGVDDRYQFAAGSTALSIFQNSPGGSVVAAFRDLGDPAVDAGRPVVFFSRNTSSVRLSMLILSAPNLQTLGGETRRADADAITDVDSTQQASPGPYNRTCILVVNTPAGSTLTRVDGAITRSGPATTVGNFEAATPSQSAYIGANSALTRHGKMLLAALALYPYVLTPAQMTQIDGHFAAAPYSHVPFGPPALTVTPSANGTVNNLSWPAVPGATKYDVERDGVYQLTVTSPGLSDPGQSASVPRVYRVRPRK